MITCENCKFWRAERHRSPNYGECINSENIEHNMAEIRHTYRFNAQMQYAAEQLYRPFYTAKDHRCLYAEARE